MAKIDITRNHSLGLNVARTTAEKVAEELRDQLKATYKWEGDNLAWKATGASGYIRCADNSVRVQADLNFLLTPLKGKLEGKVHEYLDRYLKES